MNPSMEKSAEALFQNHQQAIYQRTDRLFAALMVLQWLGGIAAALWISPRAWAGQISQPHIHVWAALFLGRPGMTQMTVMTQPRENPGTPTATDHPCGKILRPGP